VKCEGGGERGDRGRNVGGIRRKMERRVLKIKWRGNSVVRGDIRRREMV
jgi:hypothetical protein